MRLAENGLNRVPISTPAGAEELTAKENDKKHDNARSDQGNAEDRGGIGQTEGLRQDIVEEVADSVLHTLSTAMSVPWAKKVAGT
jgi:hypothetical protein